MSTNIEERDSAAEKYVNANDFNNFGFSTNDLDHCFQAGWDQALTSSVVKGLVDWIRDMPCKCGAFKHLPPPCARCEIIEKYEAAVAQVKGDG